jgi:3-hydroxyacyl-[acyl-carrier-protein] dehydratase
VKWVEGLPCEYHVDKVAQRRNMWWYRGEGEGLGGVLVAEAELGAYLATE